MRWVGIEEINSGSRENVIKSSIIQLQREKLGWENVKEIVKWDRKWCLRQWDEIELKRKSKMSKRVKWEMEEEREKRIEERNWHEIKKKVTWDNEMRKNRKKKDVWENEM